MPAFHNSAKSWMSSPCVMSGYAVRYESLVNLPLPRSLSLSMAFNKCTCNGLHFKAWIVFENTSAATKALQQMQGFDFFDKKMVLSLSFPASICFPTPLVLPLFSSSLPRKFNSPRRSQMPLLRLIALFQPPLVPPLSIRTHTIFFLKMPPPPPHSSFFVPLRNTFVLCFLSFLSFHI
jgi:hypothetical protein